MGEYELIIFSIYSRGSNNNTGIQTTVTLGLLIRGIRGSSISAYRIRQMLSLQNWNLSERKWSASQLNPPLTGIGSWIASRMLVIQFTWRILPPCSNIRGSNSLMINMMHSGWPIWTDLAFSRKDISIPKRCARSVIC